MLGTGPTPAADQNANLIIDGSDASFVADVVEASQNTPIIVDFWATWCGPCKTLGPAIEAAVIKAKGAVRLVKIDVDKNPQFAGQLRVQSIPTVFAFWQGQPVDMFQGAVPPSEIDAFVAKAVELGGGSADGGLAGAVEAAEEMLEQGDTASAVETFVAVLNEDPVNAPACGGLVRTYIAMGEFDQAEIVLDAAPEEIAKSQELDAARAQLNLARQAAQAGPLDELRARIEADGDDHQARFELATALHAEGDVETAVNELLELFKRDREWNDGAAKTQLFTIFDALEAKDPIVKNGRRKLTSMIFL
ncbi:MAG: co-chaperone YbbN [Rhodobacteraceae bacterium]|nr:co-chaperone YbbN [Paracoccaceae bacterium]